MKFSRRGMIISGIAVGGGLAVAYGLSRLDEDGDERKKFGASTPDQFVLHAYVKIAKDGTVTVAVPQAELGQGVTTAIPMLVAEELDADWSKVKYELAPLDKAYGSYVIAEAPRVFMNPGAVTEALRWSLWHISPMVGLIFTGGSSSILGNYEYCRNVGAATRGMLIAAASKAMNVKASELTTKEGRVLHAASGKSMGYGELAEAAGAMPQPEVGPSVTVKDPKNFTIMTQPKTRLDTPEKVDGSARFGIDVKLPNMVYAAIRHSPVFGATVSSFDAEGPKQRKGVISAVSVGPNAVAVIADNTWTAQKAASEMNVTFSSPATPFDSATAIAEYRTRFDDADRTIIEETDEFAATTAAAAKTVEAIYDTPYLAHICMEPMGCTALYEPAADGKLENAKVTLWSPSQSIKGSADNAARIAGIPTENVTVYATLMGGGFGRRADMDFVRQATEIAMKMPGRPVKLTWSREEDVQQDTYRPATTARFRASLDAQGTMTALDFVIVGKPVSSDFNTRNDGPFKGDPKEDSSMVMPMSSSPYHIPSMRLALNARENPVPNGNWRSVTMSHNGFYLEAFMDEVAEAAGQDPVEFRRKLLKDKPKHLAVLNTVAEKAGWGTPLAADPNGGKRGRGIAFTEAFASIVAQVVEVTVAKDGSLKVDRVVTCVDCHKVVNPNIVAAQMEGSVIDGLSAALHGKIDVKDGKVVQTNFSDYRLLKINETPVLETIVLASGGHPGGIGEPGLPGVAPALTSAIYNAIGQRVRSLPVALSGVVSA
jgi:isoquinoline 1-oxidoreductase subunit beta